ncbi:MAG: DUF192 domain-containing protein [Alphaproteobacteria bacterium]|nr:DUF192 domain-containing protein [Alphaproteobacteria bacterium]
MGVYRQWIGTSGPSSAKVEGKASLPARALQFCRRRLAIGLTLLLLVGCGFAPGLASPGPMETLEREPLSLVTAAASHPFQVEVADTDEERARGLMYRESLAPDHGMLFDFERPTTQAAMWMKNTLISLDMLFLGPEGRIVLIAADTTPGSLEPIGTRRPVRAVLELLGGTAARLGVRVGDRVEHRIFAAPD